MCRSESPARSGSLDLHSFSETCAKKREEYCISESHVVGVALANVLYIQTTISFQIVVLQRCVLLEHGLVAAIGLKGSFN